MIPNLSRSLKGLTERLNASVLTMQNKSGMVTKTYSPIDLAGNLQMGNNDDLMMVPEQERHYALWRLLVPEKAQSLKQGDIVKIPLRGGEKLFKVIGVKDNTRSGFIRYMLQERNQTEDMKITVSLLQSQEAENLMGQNGSSLIAQGVII